MRAAAHGPQFRAEACRLIGEACEVMKRIDRLLAFPIGADQETTAELRDTLAALRSRERELKALTR